ncbi:topoisomerase DNA-binding C4 zinc finger domain-containing protein [Psychrobacter proteolyticus]|uniref:topoisomerase DNA-binding C4 zinc finger domain-containing protein n=1 Tax=Psychrobacter proteolyticus TaxID=147825 RepID=UPI003D086278
MHIKTLSDLLGLELSYFHSMIAFIGECELKTRDELPEHVLTGGMVSYVKKKQDKILTEDEVASIVEQINSNRFSKSWRTNREHKAYLKDKHSNPSQNTNKQPSGNANDKPIVKVANKPVPEPIVKETAKRAILKSREVHRWFGQTEIEASDLPIDSMDTQQAVTQYTITSHDIADKVFLTPFEVMEPELAASSSATIEVIDHTADLIQTPTCPRCNGEMIKRVAKKGLNQGQTFFGCSQFPKCWGVVNID